MSPFVLLVVAPVWFWWAARLAAIDFRDHRLPDRLVLPAYPAVGLVLLANGTNAPAVAVVGITAICAVLSGYVLHQLAGLGLGDVKLGGVCTAALTATDALAPGLIGIALIGGLHATIHAGIVRSLRDEMPFGPAILTGTTLGLLSTI